MSSTEEREALERKSAAQQLARASTEGIPDRKMRAIAKADVYKQLLPVLNAQHSSEQQLHRTYRRLLAWTCGVLTIAVLTSALLIKQYIFTG